MQAPAHHLQIRHGVVQVGDYIHIPALHTNTKVADDSVFLGSDVATHAAVYRLNSKVPLRPSFDSHKDRGDYVYAGSSVRLMTDLSYVHRNVVHKDHDFVYLQLPQVGLNSADTTEKVCRSTGKVWRWTPTGWDLTSYELRLEEELDCAALGSRTALNYGGSDSVGFFGD